MPFLLQTMVGEAISVTSISAARCLRKMVSLMHSSVAKISDSTELREVQHCQRALHERRPTHLVML